MNTLRPHALCALLPAIALVTTALFLVPAPVAAQQVQSRLTPLVVNPGAASIGPTLRLDNERVGLSPITREDSSLSVGSELLQGESVISIRPRTPTETAEAARQIRQQAIRQNDEYRHKRTTSLFAD